jgi:elongation factor Ts
MKTSKESDQVKLAKVIALSEIKKLREVTGRGMMDCKKALIESDGDFDEAIKILEKTPKILIHRVNE